MKKSFLIFGILIQFFFAQSQEIDLAKSSVKWRGSHLLNAGAHFGTVHFKSGEVKMDGNRISGGAFVVDMNTITNTDDEYIASLVNHLKGPDFFDVEHYPTAQLEIVSIRYVDSRSFDADANLTIRGITKPVTFRSRIQNVENYWFVRSSFTIDRSKWDIRYKSQSFFASLGDETISDAIELDVDIVFIKDE